MIEEKTADKKKKNNGVKTIILRFLFVLFFLGFVVSRGLCLLPGWGNIVDTYGFYSAAVIGQEQLFAKLLSSGISYAYTESLVNLMQFAGFEKWFVAVYHIILQILTLFLLLIGCRLTFNKKAAYIGGMLLMISPYTFQSIFLVSPENYYLFFWTIVFCMVGIYFQKGRKSGWCRNNVGEGFLLLLGFVTGVLCIWHPFSISLFLLIFYSMCRNASYVKERVATQKNLLEMMMLSQKEQNAAESEELTEKIDDPMSNATQLIIIVMGIFLGGFCTLMKYTGITGNVLGTQFQWWCLRTMSFDGYERWQNIAVWLFIHIAVILFIGIGVTVLDKYQQKDKETAPKEEIVSLKTDDIRDDTPAAQERENHQEDWYFTLDDTEEDSWKFSEDDTQEKVTVKSNAEAEAVVTMKKEKKRGNDTEHRRMEPERHQWAALYTDTREDAEENEQKKDKKVELLENPLPLPKKHEKKIMDFDNRRIKEDFDYALRENDDFDV